jgi:hypothetical protein
MSDGPGAKIELLDGEFAVEPFLTAHTCSARALALDRAAISGAATTGLSAPSRAKSTEAVFDQRRGPFLGATGLHVRAIASRLAAPLGAWGPLVDRERAWTGTASVARSLPTRIPAPWSARAFSNTFLVVVGCSTRSRHSRGAGIVVCNERTAGPAAAPLVVHNGVPAPRPRRDVSRDAAPLGLRTGGRRRVPPLLAVEVAVHATRVIGEPPLRVGPHG